jgi:tetratricopeptide (TPR) repeat protein
MPSHCVRWFYTCLFLAILSLNGYLAYDLYTIHQAAIRRASTDIPGPTDMPQRLAWLQQSLQRLNAALPYQPADPELWRQKGRFLLMLGQLSFPHKNTDGEIALAALERAIRLMPGYGSSYFDCGLIYQKRKQYTQADNMMIRAQMFAAQDSALAPALAEYWLARYLETAGKAYLLPLRDRLYFLNLTAFSTYGERSLQIWQQVAGGQDAWHKIMPAQPGFALQSARVLLRQKNFTAFSQMLSHAPDDYLEKYLLQGHGCLAQGNVQAAIAAYDKMCELGTGETPPVREAVVELARHGHWRAASDFLCRHALDKSEYRLAIAEAAIARGDPCLPWLEQTAAAFPQLPARFYHLLASEYARGKKWSKAVAYAERAVEMEPTDSSYLSYFFSLLFSLKMEEKVAFFLQSHHFCLPQADVHCQQLARNYLAQQQPEKAFYWAQQALQLSPQHAPHQALLDEICRYIALQRGK